MAANDSYASGISESQCSSIGFNGTKTTAFADLRAEQNELKEDVKTIFRGYKALKKLQAETEPDDVCGEMELSGRTSEYSEDREGVMLRFRRWILESAFQIRINSVDDRTDQKRLRRVADFVNKIKSCLISTTPLGTETEDTEEDKALLRIPISNEKLIDLGKEYQEFRLQNQKGELGWEEDEADEEGEEDECGSIKGTPQLERRGERRKGLLNKGSTFSTPKMAFQTEISGRQKEDEERPAPDDDPLVQRLAQVREKLREETEAKEKQEEEERQQMEEMREKEEEEEERQAIEKRRKVKEAADAKSRQLRKEIAETEKRTKEERKKKEESKSRIKERKEAGKRKEEIRRKKTIKISETVAKERKEREEEGEEEEEEEEEKGKSKGGMEAYWGIHQEMLARQRMIDARPKTEEEKYGDDEKMSYMTFKRRFNAITNVQGINYLDILNEIPHWLRGSPKTMAEPFREIEDPKEAMEMIWENLDGLYALKRMTAEERMRKIMERPAVIEDDIDSLIGMLAALKGVWYEAKATKSENGLNKDEIIQDLLNEKLSFMAESFFRRQYKITKTQPLYRRGFFDIIEDLQERAQIMKARGLTSRSKTDKENVVQMAPAIMTNGPKTYSEAVKQSPPKEQQQLQERPRCEFCQEGHWSDECPSLMAMETVMERKEASKKKGLCWRCMRRAGHIARMCTEPEPKCGICSLRHMTCFHQAEIETSSSNSANEGDDSASVSIE